MYRDYEYFKKPIKVVAHRGDSKYFPENSLPAFESAIELGVDIIETDVHISSDGVIFIWHDDNTRQLDGDEEDITGRSWSELQKLDLGYLYIDNDGKRPFSSKGLRLMTFREALVTFPDARFNVDLKDRRSELVKGFFNILKEENAFDRVVVASFHTENLVEIREMSDKVVTSFGKSEVLLWVILSKLRLLRFFTRFFRNIPPVMQVPVRSGLFTVVTKRFIKVLHKRGVKIQVWTINEKEEMAMLFKMGVDGVMTDDPRLLIEVVND